MRVNYTGLEYLPSKITPEKLNNKIITAIKKSVKTGEYLQAVKDAVNKAGVNDSLMVFYVGNRTIGKGDDADIDSMAWKAGSIKNITADNSITLYYIVRKLPPMPKTLDECRGSVIADYQNKLEADWRELLRSKHTIRIDESVLNSIIKR